MVTSKTFAQLESCAWKMKADYSSCNQHLSFPLLILDTYYLHSCSTIKVNNFLSVSWTVQSYVACICPFLVFELFWKLFYTVIIFPCQKCQVALKMKQHISLEIWYLLLWKGNSLTLLWVSKSFIWVFSDMKMYRIFVMTFSDFKFIVLIEITNQGIQKFNKSKKRIMSVAEVLKESKSLSEVTSYVSVFDEMLN